MRRILVVLAVTAVAAACASSAGAQTRELSGPWVAVQTASAGSLTPIAGADRELRLVLRGVGPTVKTFDDSPGDRAGDVAVGTLLDGLFRAGDGMTHNAGITVGPRTMGVLLLSGRYDGATGTMRYRVRALRGGDRLPRRLDAPVLFIDDIGDGTTPPADCFVIAHLPAQLELAVTSTSLPSGGSWLQAPTLASPSYGMWKAAAASPTAPCASEVVLRAQLGIVDLTATIGLSSTPSPADPAGTTTCTLSGASAYMFRCNAVLAQLSPQVRTASFSIG